MNIMVRTAPIVITAGGTGGHLFPAQALAEELRNRGRRTVLITDERGLKWREAFPQTDIFATRSGTTEQPGITARLRAVFRLGLGTFEAWRLLRRYRPGVVIGFGGYPSLPTMFAAIAKGVYTCLHEQNGVMGRANKLIAPRMKAIALSFPNPKKIREEDKAKAIVTGNPVRAQVIEAAITDYVPFTQDGPLNLVVFGGSQGAQILAHVVPEAIALLPDSIKARLNVTQQCREDDLSLARAAYDKAGVEPVLGAFFNDLPQRMSNAHLIICRSGASTVCELTVLGRPAIMVPLPGALDQDQAANASFLVEAGGGWLMWQKDLSPESLAARLSELFKAPDQLVEAAACAKQQGRPDAAKQLADLVEAVERNDSRVKEQTA